MVVLHEVADCDFSQIDFHWDGVMGVPVTFLDKHNPEQFEIMGITAREDRYSLKTRKYTPSQPRSM